MMTDTKPLEYRIYLLTVWKAEDLVLGDETGWRFMLTDPRTGSRYGFKDAEPLLSIVQQAIEDEPSDDIPA
jgi:hypothetical protein